MQNIYRATGKHHVEKQYFSKTSAAIVVITVSLSILDIGTGLLRSFTFAHLWAWQLARKQSTAVAGKTWALDKLQDSLWCNGTWDRRGGHALYIKLPTFQRQSVWDIATSSCPHTSTWQCAMRMCSWIVPGVGHSFSTQWWCLKVLNIFHRRVLMDSYQV